jgi:hypothetical protein
MHVETDALVKVVSLQSSQQQVAQDRCTTTAEEGFAVSIRSRSCSARERFQQNLKVDQFNLTVLVSPAPMTPPDGCVIHCSTDEVRHEEPRTCVHTPETNLLQLISSTQK